MFVVLSFDVLGPRIVFVTIFYLLAALAALLQHADQIDLFFLLIQEKRNVE